MVEPASFAFGLALGLAAAAVIWAVSRWLLDRTGAPSNPSEPVGTSRPSPVPRRAGGPGLGVRPGAVLPRGSLPQGKVPVAFVPPELLRLSGQVLLHLARQRPLEPGETAEEGRTQAGLGRALLCPQSTLSTSLKRLALGGLVRVERRHVFNLGRRVNVYFLTVQGEQLARQLSRPPAAPPELAPLSNSPEVWVPRR